MNKYYPSDEAPAILSTPIQYNAPLFRMLAADEAIELKVVYSKQLHEVRFDKDFGREVIWDISLTDGYEHESLKHHLTLAKADS